MEAITVAPNNNGTARNAFSGHPPIVDIVALRTYLRDRRSPSSCTPSTTNSGLRRPEKPPRPVALSSTHVIFSFEVRVPTGIAMRLMRTTLSPPGVGITECMIMGICVVPIHEHELSVLTVALDTAETDIQEDDEKKPRALEVVERRALFPAGTEAFVRTLDLMTLLPYISKAMFHGWITD